MEMPLKSNGMAESSLELMTLMKKARAANQEDPYLVLLNHRNTQSATDSLITAQRRSR